MKKSLFSVALILISLLAFGQKQDTASQYVSKETKMFQVQANEEDLLLEDSIITTTITFVNADKKDTTTKMYATFSILHGGKVTFYANEKKGVKISQNNDDVTHKMIAHEYTGILENGNQKKDCYLTNGFVNGKLESIFLIFDDKVIQFILHPETKRNPNNIL